MENFVWSAAGLAPGLAAGLAAVSCKNIRKPKAFAPRRLVKIVTVNPSNKVSIEFMPVGHNAGAVAFVGQRLPHHFPTTGQRSYRRLRLGPLPADRRVG